MPYPIYGRNIMPNHHDYLRDNMGDSFNKENTSESIRLEWIDSSRGIGIIIVVFVHVMMNLQDSRIVNGGEFYQFVIFILRSFPMQVFMFLAGLFVRPRIERGVLAFLRPMGLTLVWPYLLWGTLILIAEWLGKNVRNPVDTSVVDITLLWTPIAWLWFLWALVAYHLIAAMIGRFPLVMIALGLITLVGDALLSLPPFCHLLAHLFILYAIAVAYGPMLVRYTVPSVIGAGAALLLIPLSWWAKSVEPDPFSFVATGAAISGTIATIAAAQAFRSNTVLNFLGRHSMPIYISHIFFIAAARIAILRMIGVYAPFVLFPVCLVFGFCGPLFLFWVAERTNMVAIGGFGRPVRR